MTRVWVRSFWSASKSIGFRSRRWRDGRQNFVANFHDLM